MSLAVWLGFFVAAILISVTPGPGAVISMSTGMRHGYRAALAAILGLQAAILLHLLIVALGLGALLATSEAAFVVVKFLGAAYLVWLGIGIFFLIFLLNFFICNYRRILLSYFSYQTFADHGLNFELLVLLQARQLHRTLKLL